MEPLRDGSVLYVCAGAPEHGVVRHGVATARAVRARGVDLELLTAPDAAAFLGLASALSAAVDTGRAVHLDVTDALFGPTAAAAADVLVDVLPPQATLTLHDVPQPAEGERRFQARAAACARIARYVAGVVVSSHHEADLLARVVDVPARVVPLPVQDRRAAARAPQPELPASMEGLERDVVVFGYLYPGKGHAAALDALAELTRQWGRGPEVPRRVTALGPVAAGHVGLVQELADHARGQGLEFRATGFVPDEVADAALLASGIPLAAHRNVSASGSLNSWMSVGRRAIVPAGRYTEEMARLRPGTLRLAPGKGDDYALAEAIAEAVEDPERTWIAPDASLAPGPEECARLLTEAWAEVHGW